MVVTVVMGDHSPSTTHTHVLLSDTPIPLSMQKYEGKDKWGKINSRAIEYNHQVDYTFKEKEGSKNSSNR